MRVGKSSSDARAQSQRERFFLPAPAALTRMQKRLVLCPTHGQSRGLRTVALEGQRSKPLGDLKRVERRAFQDLVATNPECQPVVERQIGPDPAHLAVVLPSDL